MRVTGLQQLEPWPSWPPFDPTGVCVPVATVEIYNDWEINRQFLASLEYQPTNDVWGGVMQVPGSRCTNHNITACAAH